jgi:hypothetical protein
MCGSNESGGNGCCCPPAQIKVEKICGNFAGPLAGESAVVWRAPAGTNDYFQGTFEATLNSGSDVTFIVENQFGIVTFIGGLNAGESEAISTVAPTALRLTNVNFGDVGRWCITLYKRVLA